MHQPACKRPAHLMLRGAVALAVIVALCLFAPGNVTKLVSAAYAGNGNGNGGGNGNGNGGNSGSAGGSNSGSAGGSNSGNGGNSGNSNAGGNSGNSNAGGGNPNAGPGNNNGKGNTDPGGKNNTDPSGKNSYTNAATGDTLSIDGDKITVVHRNGMKEQVQNGRFEMTDAQGRTIIERQATEDDLSRLLNL